jgi:hypothetical protein
MLILISQVCVIIHNILVSMRLQGELDDEVDEEGQFIAAYDFVGEFSTEMSPLQEQTSPLENRSVLDALTESHEAVTSEVRHRELRQALVDHSWARRGNMGLNF